MSPFEDQLRNALKREDPPPGFANRVIALAEDKQSWHERLFSRFQIPKFAFAMVAVAVLTVGGLQYQRYQQAVEDRKAEQAKERLMLAMRITSDKLSFVQQKVNPRPESGQSSTESR